jgi:hypothetical protein
MKVGICLTSRTLPQSSATLSWDPTRENEVIFIVEAIERNEKVKKTNEDSVFMKPLSLLNNIYLYSNAKEQGLQHISYFMAEWVVQKKRRWG